MLKPNFFIVGAPKSGTTSLYDYLKEHPDVYLPKKELYYFCYDLTFHTPRPAESVYLNYYKDATSQKAIGDASVYYLLSPGAAQRIKDFNPEANIIIMLRSPVQMVYALYNENFANGDDPMENLEKALNAETSRKAGQLLPLHNKCPLEGMFYSDVAKYYQQVLRYITVFGKDKVHVILLDDFKNDTEEEYRKVLKFLGLEQIMPATFEASNTSKSTRSRVMLKFLVNPPGFIKATARLLFPHHSKRREWLVDRLWEFNTKRVPRNPLSNELKQRLVNIYKDDIQKLGELLNRDLSGWLKV